MKSSQKTREGEIARARILEFIIRFRTDRGLSPTVREIQKGLRIASTSTVTYHLGRLEEAGAISRASGSGRIRERSIQVNEKALLARYEVEYRCTYPASLGGCYTRLNRPGECMLHRMKLIPFVTFKES